MGHGRLLEALSVLSLHFFGTFADLALPEEEPQVLAMFSTQDFSQLTPVQRDEVLKLLDHFSDIFATSSNDYGLAKGVVHQINTGDAPLFERTLIAVVVLKTPKYPRNSSNCWTLDYSLLLKAPGLLLY